MASLACALSRTAFAQEPETRSFDQLMIAGRTALKSQAFDEAAGLCKMALEKSEDPPRGGPRSVKAAKLCAEVEVARKDYAAATRRYRDASRLALDDLGEHRRLLALRKDSARDAERGPIVQVIDSLLEHDDNVQAALRRPERAGAGLSKTLAELDAAESAYAKDHEKGYVLLVKAVAVLVKARSGKAAEVRQEAEALLKEDLHRPARLAALQALMLAAEASNDADLSTDAAIQLNLLRASDQPEVRRRYARGRDLERACKKYDQAHGDGACIKREWKLTEGVTLTDFSRERRHAELSDDDLRRVHSQALPALEACVLGKARAEPDLYRNADITISWVVDGEGRAIEVGVAPKRYKEDLGTCIEGVVQVVRYPRVSSKEPKSVTVPYHLD